MNSSLKSVCAALAVSSVAATLLINIYVGCALAACSAACLYGLKSSQEKPTEQVDGDALRFAQNIADCYSDSASTPKLIGSALSPGFQFCGALEKSLVRYRLCGSASRAFGGVRACGSSVLSDTISAIVQRLDNGAELSGPLKEIIRRGRGAERYRLKSAGALLNSSSVARLGALLFFPIFAGISLQIARFTSPTGGLSAVRAGALTALFAFYIVHSNFTNFRFGPRGSFRWEAASLSCAVGIAIFKASSLLSLVAL